MKIWYKLIEAFNVSIVRLSMFKLCQKNMGHFLGCDTNKNIASWNLYQGSKNPDKPKNKCILKPEILSELYRPEVRHAEGGHFEFPKWWKYASKMLCRVKYAKNAKKFFGFFQDGCQSKMDARVSAILKHQKCSKYA